MYMTEYSKILWSALHWAVKKYMYVLILCIVFVSWAEKCKYKVFLVLRNHDYSCSIYVIDFVQTLRQDMAVSPSPSTKPHPPTQTTNNQQQPPSKRVHLSTTTVTTAKSTAKKTPKTSTKRSPASSRRKKNANSNAPKKPSNAFFWFCQEQRGSLEEQFRGEGVAGQHSLTKILAQKWGETTAEEKEVTTHVLYIQDN